jgi:hypothetical protein
VRELVLRLYKNVADDWLVRRHVERVVRESVLRRCTYAVRESVLRRCICEVNDLALHHRGELLERELVLHLYKNVVDDLLVRRHDGHVVHESVLRRCISAVRALGDRLHNGCVLREFRLAFRHPYVVVCPKDSRHHCCAWRHELQHVEILLCYVHLDRVVREVHGIRLLPPWILALRASWQQLFLLQRGEAIRLLAWIRYRGRGLVLAFGRAAFS